MITPTMLIIYAVVSIDVHELNCKAKGYVRDTFLKGEVKFKFQNE